MEQEKNMFTELKRIVDQETWNIKQSILDACAQLTLQAYTLDEMDAYLKATFKATRLNEGLETVFGFKQNEMLFNQDEPDEVVRIYQFCDCEVIKWLSGKNDEILVGDYYGRRMNAMGRLEEKGDPKEKNEDYFLARGCLYIALFSEDGTHFSSYFSRNISNITFSCELMLRMAYIPKRENLTSGDVYYYIDSLIDKGYLAISNEAMESGS